MTKFALIVVNEWDWTFDYFFYNLFFFHKKKRKSEQKVKERKRKDCSGKLGDVHAMLGGESHGSFEKYKTKCK